jgi:peroxiredoxin
MLPGLELTLTRRCKTVRVFSHVNREFTTLNLLKSIFINAFVSWLVIISLYGLIQLTRGTEQQMSWLGLTLSGIAPLAFFIKAFVIKVPRTPRHPVEYSILCGLGVVLAMVVSYRHGQAAGYIHVWAGMTLVGWLIYLRWYSVFRGRDAQALEKGSLLPQFQLESSDGHTVSSRSLMTKPHLLVFYRGNWCPFCMAQIEELAEAYMKLDESGIEAVLVSPQSIKKNQALARRFDVPLVFMRDRDNQAAKQLGIFHEWGTPIGLQLLGYGSDTVLPTVILTDSQGRIVFADQTDNYRVRPNPEVIVSLLETNHT